MEVAVYNKKAESVGKVELPDRVFGLPWNADLVHQVVTVGQANRRRVLAHTKGRGEVRGGGRKPWRQKGTGRARHGSIRSPLWKGGGVTFGPTKDRNFSKKINDKMRRKALYIALSRRLKDGAFKVIDEFASVSDKTKHAAAFLKHFSRGERGTFLLIPAAHQRDLYRATANLDNARVVAADSLNTEDVLAYTHILLEKNAIEILEKHYKL
ncbi:MAG: 50S ribosomal protein L4 [Parcubacteria group bacterium RIFCSPLOWO2_01_FULL_48_18]|nr:MAG: 50S ribosomal protein L4 [Parcubacteria group bacterium RIFCSPLOWO2_01_FULL_48_18]OHB24159.1 MAG: 50S ribosomal protein L4 [Parcubacteria group bacterium RIFCSPHIGHO2_02_FULL_48_10b]